MLGRVGTPRAAALVIAPLLAVAGCHPARGPTAPPPPLRPPPVAVARPLQIDTDCAALRPVDQDPAVPYAGRAIAQARASADEGEARLNASIAEVEPEARDHLVVQAAASLIDALRADPYDVGATYALAELYALILRVECSATLLDRLIAMRAHPSRAADIEDRFQRLLGVGAPLDAAFDGVRAQLRFRAVVNAIAAGGVPGAPTPIPPAPGAPGAPARAPTTTAPTTIAPTTSR